MGLHRRWALGQSCSRRQLQFELCLRGKNRTSGEQCSVCQRHAQYFGKQNSPPHTPPPNISLIKYTYHVSQMQDPDGLDSRVCNPATLSQVKPRGTLSINNAGEVVTRFPLNCFLFRRQQHENYGKASVADGRTYV